MEDNRADRDRADACLAARLARCDFPEALAPGMVLVGDLLKLDPFRVGGGEGGEVRYVWRVGF